MFFLGFILKILYFNHRGLKYVLLLNVFGISIKKSVRSSYDVIRFLQIYFRDFNSGPSFLLSFGMTHESIIQKRNSSRYPPYSFFSFYLYFPLCLYAHMVEHSGNNNFYFYGLETWTTLYWLLWTRYLNLTLDFDK